MALIISNAYLSQSQMTDNAQYIADYLINKGWTRNAIAGILGNMQRESTLNPGLFTATCQADMAWCSGHRQRVTHHGRMPGDIPGVTITAIQRHILMGSWNVFCGKWQTTSNGSPLPLLISRFLRLQNL